MRRHHCPVTPSRSQMARVTDWCGVSCGKSELIWKVRTRPRLTRWSGRKDVMSSPSRSMRPADAGNPPVSRLMKVVLPAPFGPIRAWRAPRGQRKVDGLGDLQRTKGLGEAGGLQREGHGRTSFDAPPHSLSPRSPPSTPPGANSTTSTMTPPMPSCQYSGLMSDSMSRAIMNTAAPTNPPYR